MGSCLMNQYVLFLQLSTVSQHTLSLLVILFFLIVILLLFILCVTVLNFLLLSSWGFVVSHGSLVFLLFNGSLIFIRLLLFIIEVLPFLSGSSQEVLVLLVDTLVLGTEVSEEQEVSGLATLGLVGVLSFVGGHLFIITSLVFGSHSFKGFLLLIGDLSPDGGHFLRPFGYFSDLPASCLLLFSLLGNEVEVSRCWPLRLVRVLSQLPLGSIG